MIIIIKKQIRAHSSILFCFVLCSYYLTYIPFLRVPISHIFMQPLSIRHTQNKSRHTCCHQQFHQTDNHELRNRSLTEPSTSSLCSSQITDSCRRSSLYSSSLPAKREEYPYNKQTQLSYGKPKQANYNDLISMNNCMANSSAPTADTKRVHFFGSNTSTESSFMSLLFDQTAHSTDPSESHHVMNALFPSFIQNTIDEVYLHFDRVAINLQVCTARFT